MKRNDVGRRDFLGGLVGSAAGLSTLSPRSVHGMPRQGHSAPRNTIPRIRFGVIGLNHAHIYAQTDAVLRGGGEIVSVFAKESDLVAAFLKRFPEARPARSEQEVLEDAGIQLVLSAAIPDERAPLGIRVMQHGKDYMVDKPGITTLDQLAEVRRVQAQTRRIYSIIYSERFENRATVRAAELVKSGAIGRVVQTIGLGPHRMSRRRVPRGSSNARGSAAFSATSRLTRRTSSSSSRARPAPRSSPLRSVISTTRSTPIRGLRGPDTAWQRRDRLHSGRLVYARRPGDVGRRPADDPWHRWLHRSAQNIDVAGRAGDSHLFLADHKDTRYIDCRDVPLPYGELLVSDVVNRTETAMPQAHCFLATELVLKAQAQAQRLDRSA